MSKSLIDEKESYSYFFVINLFLLKSNEVCDLTLFYQNMKEKGNPISDALKTPHNCRQK